MKTKSYLHTETVYKFEELSKEVQEKIIVAAHQEETEFRADMGEPYMDSVKEQLENAGLPQDDVNYRFSHSQGDGIAFYGDVEIEKLSFLDEQEIKKLEEHDAWFTLYRNGYGHHYSHSGTMAIDWSHSFEDHEDDEAEVRFESWVKNEIIPQLKELVTNTSVELEKQGYKYYHPELDDRMREFILDTCIDEGETYLENGVISDYAFETTLEEDLAECIMNIAVLIAEAKRIEADIRNRV